MNRVRSIVVALSGNACATCNEPFDLKVDGSSGGMSKDMLKHIADLAGEHSWTCTVLADEEEVPAEYQQLCEEMGAEVAFPADHGGKWIPKRAAIVFDMSGLARAERFPPTARAILRVRREDLPQLSRSVEALLSRFRDVTIRQPEVTSYDRGHLEIYERQLQEIGRHLLRAGSDWDTYRVDRLTDGFTHDVPRECGAGDTTLAVSPQGDFYVCEAAMRGGMPSCGNVREGVIIPDRHLMTRQFALPCRDKCKAFHCERCVYLNKLATLEFCVPPAGMCRAAHVEMQVQSQIGREAEERGIWNRSWRLPPAPTVHDPFELCKEAEEEEVEDTWMNLASFSGDPAHLTPAMMYEILCDLCGRLDAIRDCMKAGAIPSQSVLEDFLSSIRRNVTERYRDCTLVDGCPTVHEVERAIHRACTGGSDREA